MWVNNNVDNSNNHDTNTFNDNKSEDKSYKTLSCGSCFETLSFESKFIKNFPGLYYSKKLLNSFKNYERTFSKNEIFKIFKENLKNLQENNNNKEDDSESFTFLKEVTNNNDDNNKIFISVYCQKCSNLVAIYDGLNSNYYVFNTF